MSRKRSKHLASGQAEWSLNLEVVHGNAAGIDIGNESHYVAVALGRDSNPVRQFACFTVDLHRLADWLKSCGIDTVAMQSTGVYWLPVYEILAEKGLEVHLVNARHTKNLPGRKSDVQECQWLLQLHTFGLLNNSFRPPEEIFSARLLAATGRTHGRSGRVYSKDAEGTHRDERATRQCHQRYQRPDGHGHHPGHSQWRAGPLQAGKSGRSADTRNPGGNCP
jgi:Transposase